MRCVVACCLVLFWFLYFCLWFVWLFAFCCEIYCVLIDLPAFYLLCLLGAYCVWLCLLVVPLARFGLLFVAAVFVFLGLFVDLLVVMFVLV